MKKEKTDSYDLELARDSLNKVVNELRHAEQYILKAELIGMADSISRLISAVENRNKEIGKMLIP